VNVTANGIAAALLRKRTLAFSRTVSPFLSFNGLHFPPFCTFQKPNPKNELFVGFVTSSLCTDLQKQFPLEPALFPTSLLCLHAFSLLTNIAAIVQHILPKCSPLLQAHGRTYRDKCLTVPATGFRLG
jgi:hypothetical protein